MVITTSLALYQIFCFQLLCMSGSINYCFLVLANVPPWLYSLTSYLETDCTDMSLKNSQKAITLLLILLGRIPKIQIAPRSTPHKCS